MGIQNFMAQTFTGKMFNNFNQRNNSLKQNDSPKASQSVPMQNLTLSQLPKQNGIQIMMTQMLPQSTPTGISLTTKH